MQGCDFSEQSLRQHRHQSRISRLHTQAEDQSDQRGSPRGSRQGRPRELPREGVQRQRMRQFTLSKRRDVPADLRGGSVQRSGVQEASEEGQKQEQSRQQGRGEHSQMPRFSLHVGRADEDQEEREKTLRQRQVRLRLRSRLREQL